MGVLFAIFEMWGVTAAVAAGAASIPIVIHLLNRKRFRVVNWAAMKFLLAAQRQNTRRMRLEQLLLLAVRVLLVLLIIGAMWSVSSWAETNVWSYFWPEGVVVKPGRSGRTHKIVVLDGSLSMNLERDTGGTCFDAAKKLAMRLVRESSQGDGFSVLLMKDSPAWIVSEPSQDRSKVAEEIENLRPTHGNAGVPAMLNAVLGKFADGAERFQHREVYFFTDMQQATWNLLPAVEEAKNPEEDKEGARDGKEAKPAKNVGKSALDKLKGLARAIFVDVGHKANNLAITDLRVDAPFITTGRKVPVTAVVRNFGDQRYAGHLELHVGRAKESVRDEAFSLREKGERQPLTLDPGQEKRVTFLFPFDDPGAYAVQARLGKVSSAEGERECDRLAADNARAVIVTVRKTVPVLLVNGKPAAEPFERGTEFLRLALNPFAAGAEPKMFPLRPREVSPEQFGQMSEADLLDYDCICLCDVGQLSNGDVHRLENHLSRGGGVIFAPGDRTAEHLESIDRLLYKNGQGLLPARLIKKVEAGPERHFFMQATPSAFSQPPLKAFADDDDQASLSRARFRQYLQAKAADSARARIILSFASEIDPDAKNGPDDALAAGVPALIEWNPPMAKNQAAGVRNQEAGGKRQGSGGKDERTKAPGRTARYRGKVILFTSTLNMDWNTWPGAPSYGAMMQELARLAVSGRLREHSVQVGQVLEEFFPAQGSEIDLELYCPEGSPEPVRKIQTQLVDEVNVFRFTDTDWSGVYRLTSARDPQERLFAVNAPAATPDRASSESDLARLDTNRLLASYPGWDMQVVTDPAQVSAPGDLPGDLVAAPPPGKVGPYIAYWAICAVLGLTLLEVLLAWQFGHYSAVAGTHQHDAKGRLGPIVVACVAGLLLAAGAFVLIKGQLSGDMFGFLETWGLRTPIEGALDIPPPPPGEARQWKPEFDWGLSLSTATWLIAGIAIAAILLIAVAYRGEAAKRLHPAYRFLLGGLRLFLVLIALFVLWPQFQWTFTNQSWPDIALLIDDSKSMNKDDPFFSDDGVRDAVKSLGEDVKKRLQETLPEKIQALEDRIAGVSDPEAGRRLRDDLKNLQSQRDKVNSAAFRPTRLQLAQALLARHDRDWLTMLVHNRKTKVHLYHLDAEGRALKVDKGDVGADDPQRLQDARRELAALEPLAMKTRLASGIRDILNDYRGASLSAIILLTDGVPVHDSLTLAQASEYAAGKNVPLFFVGIGDEDEIRGLKLSDLQVDDPVFVNDRVIFEARLTGQGYKDLTVPVVLKVKDKAGHEKEVHRERVKVPPSGRPARIKLHHTPTQVGMKTYIIEVLSPKGDRPEKNAANPRLQREIEVIDTKLVKVLYIEGTPRYEFRFLKSLLEREGRDDKKKKAFELKVLLQDADAGFAQQDRTALAAFPATMKELNEFDVIILGDADPKKLGEQNLRMIADFVRGEEGGKRTGKTGGGLLMIAGPHYAPHAYKKTPIADVLPIEPTERPDEPEERLETFRLQLTPPGRQHPLFRFTPDDNENQGILRGLAPLYWYAEGYRLKPLAEELAMHPSVKGSGKDKRRDGRLPLIVQQFVGAGRTMFFGFEETWRWRAKDGERRYHEFWRQCMRYLSRSRPTRTTLRLDRQSTPYRVNEPIKVTVQFPEALAGAGAKDGDSKVKVRVEYRSRDEGELAELQELTLERVPGSWNIFEAYQLRTREGRYRFVLKPPPGWGKGDDGPPPEATAIVEPPPGELDRVRMNQSEMEQAARTSEGGFYTLANAGQLLDDLPPGFRVSLPAQHPPFRAWNHLVCLAIILFLLTSEWLLRKRKHLL